MRERSVFSAVVLRHRWWTYHDAPEAVLIRAGDNVISARGMVRIAKAYAVRRGLNLHGDGAPDRLAAKLSEELREFGGSLRERASRLTEIAQAIQSLTHGLQVSAVSKFAWFMWPDDWTMYDRRAREALGSRDHIHFYQKLEQLEFSGTAAKVDRLLKDSGFEQLSSGRVVDTYLLLRYAEDRNSDNELADAYLNSLSQSAQMRLRAAAEQITELISRDPLVLEAR